MQTYFSDEELRKKVNQIASGLSNPEPLAADIERVLISHTLQNFHHNGRPAWMGLSQKTLESYAKKGIVPLGILQRSGALKDSVQGDHDNKSVTIGAGSGASKDYAAIHQWGGKAGRGRKVTIPARPYLPIDKAGFLQSEAELGIELIAKHYLMKLAL